MAALGRLIRREYPDIALGIILQAHDGEGPIAVAKAAGARFVRLKVYAGSVIGGEGPKHALGVAARACRCALAAEDVAILADVHDRTTVPYSGASFEQTAQWALGLGADGLVATGSSFDDSLDRIARLRRVGISVPVLLGGGATAANVRKALEAADGVVVSTALMLKDRPAGSVLAWDRNLCGRFMDEARKAP